MGGTERSETEGETGTRSGSRRWVRGVRAAGELLRQVAGEARRDRVVDEAARAAYYFFLSLFPLLLVLFALTGILGGEAAFDWIVGRLRLALPADAADFLVQYVDEITGTRRPGLLSFGILFSLWSGSKLVTAIASGLNRVYDLEEGRAWWLQRILSVAAVLTGATALIASALLLLAGPEVLETIGLGALWSYLRWPLVFALLVGLLTLLYLALPNRSPEGAGRSAVIGALVGAALWVLATAGFGYYVGHFAGYTETYGVIGGVIVLLLWLHLTAASILLGGEVAATLEQRATEGWEVGQAPADPEG